MSMARRKRKTVLGPRFWKLLDHILEGPSAMYPPGASGTYPWLGSFASLKRERPFRGPVELRQIYELPNMIKGVQGYDSRKDYVNPLIRQVVWDRDNDHYRSRPRWPSIQCEMFEVKEQHFKELHHHVFKLDKALPSFPFEPTGVSKARRRLAKQGLIPTKADPALDYYLTLERVTQFASARLWCDALASTAFGGAFMQLWDFLSELCTARSRASKEWKERWDVTPKKYAAALDVAFPPRR